MKNVACIFNLQAARGGYEPPSNCAMFGATQAARGCARGLFHIAWADNRLTREEFWRSS
jgi:hypothetical protein